MIVKLLTEHHLEFLSLKGGCRVSSESTHVKIPHCWKSHALAHIKVQFHSIGMHAKDVNRNSHATQNTCLHWWVRKFIIIVCLYKFAFLDLWKRHHVDLHLESPDLGLYHTYLLRVFACQKIKSFVCACFFFFVSIGKSYLTLVFGKALNEYFAYSEDPDEMQHNSVKKSSDIIIQ